MRNSRGGSIPQVTCENVLFDILMSFFLSVSVRNCYVRMTVLATEVPLLVYALWRALQGLTCDLAAAPVKVAMQLRIAGKKLGASSSKANSYCEDITKSASVLFCAKLSSAGWLVTTRPHWPRLYWLHSGKALNYST